MTRPDVSVLLVSWNTLVETRRCLDALPAAVDDGLTYEVIAVDNASQDGSAELLADRSDVRLIRNEHNRGFAAAVNQANQAASADLILLLNSDLCLRPGALSALVRFLRDRPAAAGVAPLYTNPDGTVQPHYMRLPTLGSALALATGLRLIPPIRQVWRSYQMHGADFTSPCEVEQPSASCLLLRRSVLDSSQVFDERLPIYFNDVLLAHRLREAGHALWMTPEAVAVHTLGASTRLLGPAARARHHLGGLVRYLRLTHRRSQVVLFQCVVFVDRVLRRLLRRRGALSMRDLCAAIRGDVGPLPDDSRRWLVMLSSIRWSAAAACRQHALARELAVGRQVLFVDPPAQGIRWRLTVEQVGPSLWHAAPPSVLPIGRYVPLANRLNRAACGWLLRRLLDRMPGPRTVWIDEDLAGPLAGRLGEDTVVYDGTDLDWTFTRPWNRWHLRRNLRKAVQSADLVLASSPALPERLPQSRRPPVVVANGCDPDHFADVGPVRDWVSRLHRPVLGYAGAIDDRAFDVDLLAVVARYHPEWTFLLVGPVTPANRERLACVPNVHLAGAVPFDEVPAILRGCDVCLIPYRVGGRIDYVFPKKLYEYLALGKPVVATPLPSLTRMDGGSGLVHLARGPVTFATAIEKALVSSASLDESADRRAAALRNSWSVRGEQLRRLLDECEGARC